MKSTGILFKGEMIRAILRDSTDNPKDQTRRIITPQPVYVKHSMAPQQQAGQAPIYAAPYLDSYCSEPKTAANPRGMSDTWCWWDEFNRCGDSFKCPYGAPADELWVRETWAPHADAPGSHLYRADPGGDYQDTVTPNFRWRPSLLMPRAACRIFLTLTEVLVERLQDITEEDALSEGCPPGATSAEGVTDYNGYKSARAWYRALWNSISATPKPVYVMRKNTRTLSHYQAFPWSLEDFERLHPGSHAAGRWKGHELRVTPNPYVWVLKFQRKGMQP